MNKKIETWGRKVFIERAKASELTAGGVVLPDAARELLNRGKVVGSKNSQLRGKEVMFDPYSGTTITVDDDDLLVIEEDDILAVIG